MPSTTDYSNLKSHLSSSKDMFFAGLFPGFHVYLREWKLEVQYTFLKFHYVAVSNNTGDPQKSLILLRPEKILIILGNPQVVQGATSAEATPRTWSCAGARFFHRQLGQLVHGFSEPPF